MKSLLMISIIAGLVAFGCKKQEATAPDAPSAPAAEEVSNIPPLSENNIMSLAIASEDHTTLVTAIKAADYVTSIAASGPLTVFAPTNAAFDKLPEGTVENLTSQGRTHATGCAETGVKFD